MARAVEIRAFDTVQCARLTRTKGKIRKISDSTTCSIAFDAWSRRRSRARKNHVATFFSAIKVGAFDTVEGGVLTGAKCYVGKIGDSTACFIANDWSGTYTWRHRGL